ncbi:MAG: hypothetical protein R2911_08075 [Caldilineaceae bacterium]
MTLDESTRRNLELTSTIRSGETKGSLLEVLDDTLTPMGGRLLRRRLNQPLLDVAAINAAGGSADFLRSNFAAAGITRAAESGWAIWSAGSIKSGAGHCAAARLGGHPREALRKVPEIHNVHVHAFGVNDGEQLTHLFNLPTCDEILHLLEAALADEPPATLSTPGMIRVGYSEELDGLVHKSRHAKEWIANLEKSERERLDIKSLKVGYNKVFGYYIEVTHVHVDKVPDEYIRKQTLTNAERYITPDLKEYESLVLNADERRLDIEQQIFKNLCDRTAAMRGDLLLLAMKLAELDVYAALAEVGLHRRYMRPQVDEGPGIEIMGGRHPVVELTLTDEPFVPNDTHLTPDAAIHVLTGPNMAGKSTFPAPDRADYTDGADWQLCAGGKWRRSAWWTASLRALALAMRFIAASPLLWWRWWRRPTF